MLHPRTWYLCCGDKFIGFIVTLNFRRLSVCFFLFWGSLLIRFVFYSYKQCESMFVHYEHPVLINFETKPFHSSYIWARGYSHICSRSLPSIPKARIFNDLRSHQLELERIRTVIRGTDGDDLSDGRACYRRGELVRSLVWPGVGGSSVIAGGICNALMGLRKNVKKLCVTKDKEMEKLIGVSIYCYFKIFAKLWCVAQAPIPPSAHLTRKFWYFDTKGQRVLDHEARYHVHDFHVVRVRQW